MHTELILPLLYCISAVSTIVFQVSSGNTLPLMAVIQNGVIADVTFRLEPHRYLTTRYQPIKSNNLLGDNFLFNGNLI